MAAHSDSSQRTMVRNTAWMSISRVAVMVLSVGTFAILGRTLSLPAFGVLALAIGFSEIFGTIFDFGMSYHAIRDVAQGGNARRLHGVGAWLRAVLVLPALIAVVGLIWLAYEDSWRIPLGLGALGGATRAQLNYVLGFYTGRERLGVPAVVQFLLGLSSATVTVGAVLLGVDSVDLIMLLRVLALGATLAGTYAFFLRDFGFAVGPHPLKEIRALWGSVLPFGLFFVGGIVYFQADSVLLSLLLDEESVGVYQAAIRIVLTFEALPLVVTTAAYPTLSRLYVEDRAQCGRLLQQLTKALALGGMFLMLVAMGYAEVLIRLVYSANLLGSAPVLSLLLILVPIRFFGGMPGLASTVGGAQTRRTVAVYVCVVFNIGLNLLVIPLFGVTGAAWASVATSTVLVTLYGLIQEVIRPSALVLRIAVPCVAASIPSLLLMWSGWLGGFPESMAGLVHGALFLVMAGALGILDPTEVRALFQLVRRARAPEVT